MKATLVLPIGIFLALALGAPLAAQEPSAEDLLRDGLFEEEARGQLAEAEKAYRRLLERYDEERRFAGTALFRLAEIARKRGDEEAAAAYYRRVAREFGDQEVLAKRAAENLASMGEQAPVPSAPATLTPAISEEERSELQRLKNLQRNSPDRLDGVNEEGLYPLHRAAANGWVQAVEFLLEREVSVDPRSAEKESAPFTPLHLAVMQGHLAVVDALIEAGAEAGATVSAVADELPVPAKGLGPDAGGSWTPVHLAALYGRDEILARLLAADPPLSGEVVYQTDYGAQLNASQRRVSGTPLILAVAQGNEEAVKLLLRHGADVNEDVDGNSPLFAAVRSAPELVPLLLEAGAEVNDRHFSLMTLLHEAVRNGNLAVVKLLVENGASLETVNQYSKPRTPLELAIVYRDAKNADADSERAKIVKHLLESGAKPTMQALISAAGFGKPWLTAALLEAGAPVGARGDGWTALHSAENVEVAKLLLEAGADPNAQAPNGVTPLIALMGREDTEENRALVDLYLERGAEVSQLVKSVQPKADPALSQLIRETGGQDAGMVKYVLERAVYPKLRDGKTIQLFTTDGWRVDSEMHMWIQGTPPPTFPEFLAISLDRLKVAPSRSGIDPRASSGPTRIRRVPNPRASSQDWISGIRVFRRSEDGSFGPAVVLGSQELAAGRLPELHWGDVVELTRQNASGLEIREALNRIEPRTITLKLGPWSGEVIVNPDEIILPRFCDDAFRLHRRSNSGFIEESWATAVGCFDFAAVVLRRATGQEFSFAMGDLSKVPPIRLLDGDSLEVPSAPRLAQEGRWNDRFLFLFPDDLLRNFRISAPHDGEQLFDLLASYGWESERNYSEFIINRVVDGELVTTPIDLVARVAEIPEDEWTEEKAREVFGDKMKAGDLVILPSRTWRQDPEEAAKQGERQEVLRKFLARTVSDGYKERFRKPD